VVSQAVSDDALERAGLNLDIEFVKSQVDEVLSDDLYWFPVRHHSPNVALNLLTVLKQRKPKVILIEGPSQATHLIPYLVHAKTKPPVAIYTSFRDDANALEWAGILSPAEDIAPTFPAWYPFLQYSPEFVAMMFAKEQNIPVELIDLPHYARIMKKGARADAPFDDDDDDRDEETEDGDGAGETSRREKTKEYEFGSEHLIIESRFYQQLAKTAGFRTFDEAWDTLFEMRNFDDPEQFRREMGAFCAASRVTTLPLRMIADGTVARERQMTARIKQVLAERQLKPTDAIVICGGFHLFLNREDKESPPPIPQGTIYNTIVPYSFFRVSQLAGYEAGTRAPQFYQRFWDLAMAKRGGDIVAEHVVSVLHEVRKKGNVLSSADAIAVSQHTEMLSRLRGRAMPVLDDIHDALITCCCKGDPAEEGDALFAAMDAAGVGSSIGKVTADLGQLPIVDDFYKQIKNLELDEVLGKEKRLNVQLDKRETMGERRSVFLHRLRFLEVPLCALAEAPSGDIAGGMIFREKWALKWSPGVEAELIELNVFGDSIESAALARLRRHIGEEENNSGQISLLLLRAVDMDLPDLIGSTEAALSQAIDNDTRFVSLSRALTTMLVLERYMVYRNLRQGALDSLIERCFDRACFAILDVVSAPDAEQENMVSGLVALAEVAQRGDKGLDRNLFAQHVRSAASTTQIAFVKGALLGVLSEIRELDPKELSFEISALAKAPVEIMVTAGDFLDGVMAVSRTSIMIGADSLIEAVDELLRAAEWDPFLIMLPKMRGAFERMHAGHRDSLASRLAQVYGLKDGSALTNLRLSQDAAVTVARIDQRVASIMKEWNL